MSELTREQIELKPCPHCGGDARFDRVPNEQDTPQAGGEYVECADCHASTALVFPLKGDVKRELIERWNRRALQPSGDAAREGYVLVPKEPLMSQWDDFTKVFPVPFDKFLEAYKAMLAALPAAPAGESDAARMRERCLAALRAEWIDGEFRLSTDASAIFEHITSYNQGVTDCIAAVQSLPLDAGEPKD